MIDFTTKKTDKVHEFRITTDNAKLAHKIRELLNEYTKPISMDVSSFYNCEVKPLSISRVVKIAGEEIELCVKGLKHEDAKNKESYSDIEGVYPAN